MSKPINLVVLPKCVVLALESVFNDTSRVTTDVIESVVDAILHNKTWSELVDEAREDHYENYGNYDDCECEHSIVWDYVGYIAEAFLYTKEFDTLFKKFKDLGYKDVEIIGFAEETDTIDFNDKEENAICELVNESIEYGLEDSDFVYCLFRTEE